MKLYRDRNDEVIKILVSLRCHLKKIAPMYVKALDKAMVEAYGHLEYHENKQSDGSSQITIKRVIGTITTLPQEPS